MRQRPRRCPAGGQSAATVAPVHSRQTMVHSVKKLHSVEKLHGVEKPHGVKKLHGVEKPKFSARTRKPCPEDSRTPTPSHVQAWPAAWVLVTRPGLGGMLWRWPGRLPVRGRFGRPSSGPR
jgi:hypothetical protein